MHRLLLALTLVAGPAVAGTEEGVEAPAPAPVRPLEPPRNPESPLAPTPAFTPSRPQKPSPWWRVGRVAGGLLLGTTAQVALALGGNQLGWALDRPRPGVMYEGTMTAGALVGTVAGAVIGATLAVYGLGYLLMGDGALWATAVGAVAPILVSFLAALVTPAGGYLLFFAPFVAPAIGAVIGYEVTSSADRRVRVGVSALPVRDGAGFAVGVAF